MDNWLSSYEAKGYHFPLRVFSEPQALHYRTALEELESSHQGSSDLKLAIGQSNSLIPFVDEITRSEAVLDRVTQILGPNILVWNSSFFIKEPGTKDFISWHQDLTYWGLTDSHEVTAWIALSQASIQSGCMKFIPGSHTGSIVEHKDTFDENNLLSRGQELAVEMDEADASTSSSNLVRCHCTTDRFFMAQISISRMTVELVWQSGISPRICSRL